LQGTLYTLGTLGEGAGVFIRIFPLFYFENKKYREVKLK